MSTVSTPQHTTTSAALRAGGITIAVAAVLNVLVWSIARIAGVDFEVTQNGDTTTVDIPTVLLMTVVPLALGTLALWLTRNRARAWTAWACIGLALGVLTVFAPFSVEATTETSVSLALMHLVAGGTWFAVLTRAQR